LIVYLDSSAIVKRYVLETGSNIVKEVYEKALNGELEVSFSAWNIGEVLGVFDKYLMRKWLREEDYKLARFQFISETLRLVRLKLVKIIPVRTKLLVSSWKLMEKYHVYEADALQIVSAKYANADQFLTGDKRLHEIATEERLNSVCLG